MFLPRANLWLSEEPQIIKSQRIWLCNVTCADRGIVPASRGKDRRYLPFVQGMPKCHNTPMECFTELLVLQAVEPVVMTGRNITGTDVLTSAAACQTSGSVSWQMAMSFFQRLLVLQMHKIHLAPPVNAAWSRVKILSKV